MADYRVQVTTLGGTEKVADLFFTELTISDVLNGPGAVSFAVPLLHADATADNLLPGAREINVYRGSTKVFGGRLWAVTADVDARVVRCAAEGHFATLRRRIVTADLVYLGTDQLDIAWGLIAHTQVASSLGITRGSSMPSGVTRDMVWCVEDAAVVGDAIAELATSDPGFDYWIDPDKVWRTAYPQRGSASGVVFDAGQNVSRMQLNMSGDYLASTVIGYDETVNCVPQTTTVTDATALSNYGLLQATVPLDDLHNATDKSARLAEELRQRKQTAVQASITTVLNPWGDGYGVGDTAALIVSAGIADYDATPFRVLSHATTVRGAWETTSVVLDSVTA